MTEPQSSADKSGWSCSVVRWIVSMPISLIKVYVCMSILLREKKHLTNFKCF